MQIIKLISPSLILILSIITLLATCGDEESGGGGNNFIKPPPIIFTAGNYHNCARVGGVLKCWGINDYGELGDGTTDTKTKPIEVTALGEGTTVKSIGAGGNFTCAILSDDLIKCWGINDADSSGPDNGETCTIAGFAYSCALTSIALDFGQERTAKAISVGNSHSCAILDNQSLKCWGGNPYGQLANGSKTSSSVPIAINLGTKKTAAAVSAGGGHVCAILDDNSLKCWGYNSHGQLGHEGTNNWGDNSAHTLSSIPAVDLGTDKTAVAISAGDKHTCVILNDASLKCWGYNGYGQLGNGNVNNLGDASGEMGDGLAVVSLGTDKTAKAISAGTSHTCAILDNDSIKCWGLNHYEQLGAGSITNETCTINSYNYDCKKEPVAVVLPEGRTAQAVSAGTWHTCALLDDDSIACWGDNSVGQLGDGTTNGSNVPVVVEF